jgi:taurine dioxygenase
MSSFVVHPLDGASFGAEITGLDPRHITDHDVERIWATYRERHGLLCFTFDRLLTADELHGLTAVFGENELAPGRVTGVGRGVATGEVVRSVESQIAELRARGVDPYLAYIGNVDPDTLEVGDVPDKFYGEWEWHTDMSYIDTPPTFSLLHARSIPLEGGDTGFCSQVMAAAALPPDERERILPLRLKHDSTYASSGVLRPGMTPPASPIEAQGGVHPILRRVGPSGDEALFLGRRTNGYIVGLPLEESEALLDTLWAHATRPEFCYRHSWRVGQVMVWDNRMLLHKRHPMNDDDVRFMWRTQTKGEAVVAATAGS